MRHPEWMHAAGMHAFAAGAPQGSLNALGANARLGWSDAETKARADGFGFARVDTLKPGEEVWITVRGQLKVETIKSVEPTKTGRGRMVIRYHSSHPGSISVRLCGGIVLVKRAGPHAALMQESDARRAVLIAKHRKDDA